MHETRVAHISLSAPIETLISQIDRAVKRGALHRNAGARKKSRAAKLRSKL